ERDLTKAAELYRRGAELGDAEAASGLGCLYFNGLGVERNVAEAARWLRKAADGGAASALFNLGYMFEVGEGVEQNWDEAIRLYREAAERGDDFAPGRLGAIYAAGEAVERDMSAAVAYWKLGVERGCVESACSLGSVYAVGDGVEQSWDEAFRWFREAVALGSAEAASTLAKIYLAGVPDGEPNEREAVAWLRKADELGDCDATNRLGRAFFDGAPELGIEKDEAEAVRLYRKAANAGDGEGLNNLAFATATGAGGLEPNLDEARRLYEAAFEAGYVDAANNLGALLLGETGEEEDDEDEENGDGGAEEKAEEKNVAPETVAEALRWFRTAAEAGSADAAFRLGDYLRLGVPTLGIDANPTEAVRWLRIAAEGEEDGPAIGAALALSVAFEEGVGVEKDAAEAARWEEEATRRALSAFGGGEDAEADDEEDEEDDGETTEETGKTKKSEELKETGESENDVDVDALSAAELYRLGRALCFGVYGVKIDKSRGVAILEAAVEAGKASDASEETRAAALDAQAELAEQLSEDFDGRSADWERAVELAAKPAEAGNPFALFTLGNAASEGVGGVEADETAANAFYRRAVEAFLKRAKDGCVVGDDPRAMCFAAYYLNDGEFVERDAAEAVRLY
ncbi:MAG: sel1 repeat family protein, partial [Thermoguttaceae bacterium]|nr:sel1 repeat family protein [Thermoguttaceae bacterium]